LIRGLIFVAPAVDRQRISQKLNRFQIQLIIPAGDLRNCAIKLRIAGSNGMVFTSETILYRD
jgi:hypothetical protein